MSIFPAARYTIVSAKSVGDQGRRLEYDAGTEIEDIHDEVILVNVIGRPCGIPVFDRNADLDSQYLYLQGDRGSINDSYGDHELTISCNHLPATTRRKLDMWMQRRTPVLFAPGFGPRTEVAYRPHRMLDALNYDLTGRYHLTQFSDSDEGFIWDDWNGRAVALGKATSDDQPRLVRLPYGGAGQVYAPNTQNIATKGAPAYGDIGWMSSGLGITESLASAGFGPTDAVHWQGDERDTDRVFSMASPISAAPGSFDVTVWIKGRVTQAATVSAYCDVSDIKYVNLFDLDIGIWRAIRLRGVHSSGTTMTVQIRMDGTAGVKESFDIMVGPIMKAKEGDGNFHSPMHPPWLQTYATRKDDYTLVERDVGPGGFVHPREGSVFCSFWVPDWFDESKYLDIGVCSHASGNAGAIRIIKYLGIPQFRFTWNPNESTSIGATVVPRHGEMNSLGVSFSSTSVVLYWNGEVVETEIPGEFLITMPQLIDFRIGLGNSENTMWPLILAQLRVEREVWSAARHADEHFTATDPFVINGIAAARGRWYEIAAVPDSKQIVAGGHTNWSGMLNLRQVSYHKNLSDITTCEGDYL